MQSSFLTNTLRISCAGAIQVCFVMLMSSLLHCPYFTCGWGLVARGTSQGRRGLELLTPPLDLRGGERLQVDSIPNGRGFNQSHLCEEASLKPERSGVGGRLGWWTLGRWRGCRSSRPFPWPCLRVFSQKPVSYVLLSSIGVLGSNMVLWVPWAALGVGLEGRWSHPSLAGCSEA